MSDILAEYFTVESLLFAAVCTIVAALAIVVDWLLLMFRNRSFLNVSYGSKSPLLVLALWSLAAGVIGFFAGMFAVVQQTLQGAVAVAVGWPVLATRVFKSEGANEVQQYTEEEAEGENDAN